MDRWKRWLLMAAGMHEYPLQPAARVVHQGHPYHLRNDRQGGHTEKQVSCFAFGSFQGP